MLSMGLIPFPCELAVGINDTNPVVTSAGENDVTTVIDV